MNKEVCDGVHGTLDSLFNCSECKELFNYCHCYACDIVINIDLDEYVVVNDNTYCLSCNNKGV